MQGELANLVRIGTLGKPHGTQGEMLMHIDDDIFDRQDADCVFLGIDGLPVPFFFEEYRFKSDTSLYVKFEGIDSVERAKELTGAEVLYPASRFADEDAPNYSQLVGFMLIDATDGSSIGTIERVDCQTENTLFEVGDHLIPAAAELIERIDSERRTVSIRLPEGLLSI